MNVKKLWGEILKIIIYFCVCPALKRLLCFTRYEYRELDSAKTWIEAADTNFHHFDELHLTGGAHIAFMPDGNLTTPVQLEVGELFGDTTGENFVI